MLGFLSPTSGRSLYRGSPVGALKGKSYARFRQEVQAITQDPYSAFNPFYRVGRVFDTVIRNFPIATERRGREGEGRRGRWRSSG